MKIEYKPNPSETIVHLEESDKDRLSTAVWESGIVEAAYSLYFNKDDPTKLERNMEKLALAVEDQIDIDYLVEDLKHKHMGDCTCVPCSCMKCYAEDKLGISTIRWFSKHSLYKIDDAFKREGATIDSVIDFLENDYEKDLKKEKPASWERFTQEQYEFHFERWIREAKIASNELKQYKEDVGF